MLSTPLLPLLSSVTQDFPAGRRYPFGNAEATVAVLAGYPKISAIIASVQADANVAAYLAGRGKQMF